MPSVKKSSVEIAMRQINEVNVALRDISIVLSQRSLAAEILGLTGLGTNLEHETIRLRKEADKLEQSVNILWGWILNRAEESSENVARAAMAGIALSATDEDK